MSDNTAQFNFYLNRQGVTGKQGAKGEKGFSPVISVEKDTLSEYILRITNESSYFLTTNLRESKEDRGGTYIRYDRDQGIMYAGDADRANKTQYGEVKFATPEEITAGDEGTVLSPADVEDILTKYVTTNTEQTITGQKNFYEPIKTNQGIQLRGTISARDARNGVNPDIIHYYNGSGDIVLGEISQYPTDGTMKNVGIEIRQNNISNDAGLYTHRDTNVYPLLDSSNVIAGDNITIDKTSTGITINSTGGGVTDVYTKAETDELLDAKQNKLVAGTGITISGNNEIYLDRTSYINNSINYVNKDTSYGEIKNNIFYQLQNNDFNNPVDGFKSLGFNIPSEQINSFDFIVCVKLVSPHTGNNGNIMRIGLGNTEVSVDTINGSQSGGKLRFGTRVSGTSKTFVNTEISDTQYTLLRLKHIGTDNTLRIYSLLSDIAKLPEEDEWISVGTVDWDILQYQPSLETGDLHLQELFSIGGANITNLGEDKTYGMQSGNYYLAFTRLIVNENIIFNGSAISNPAEATKDEYGLVKIDFSTITINPSGQLQANIPSNLTTQGNTFNGASQLVQLDSDGKLPAIDGSQLINLSSSTPANMVTTDTAQTITGQKVFRNSFVTSDGTATTGNRVLINNSRIDLIANSGRSASIDTEGINLRGGINSSGLSLQSSSQIVVFGQNNTPMRIHASQLERYSNGNDNGAIILDAKNFSSVAPTGNLKYWTGTEADYTGLATKDADTLYRTTDTNKVFLGTIQIGGNS